MSKPEKISAATFLIDHVVQGKMRLIRDDQDVSYAVFKTGASRQCWPLTHRSVVNFLAERYYFLQQKVISHNALRDCLATMAGLSRLPGCLASVSLRTAAREHDLFIDLCNEEWAAVRIHNGSWEVVSNPPVYFRRTAGMLPMPAPARDGSVDLLRRYANIGNDDNWLLVRAWLTAAMRPNGPYPCLVLAGQQGSAKSNTARFLRRLVDPNVAAIRQEPKNRHDLIIAAHNSWMIVYDNLSFLTTELQDAFCCLATGSSFTCRSLFTDSEEVIFAQCRPTCLTSIEDVATRSDMLDRAILIHPPVLDRESRRSEVSLWGAFEQDLPFIFGGALDVVAAAQKRFRYVKDHGMPRMADFSRWGVAIEQALGEPEGSFLAAYENNLAVGKSQSLESSPLIPALLALATKWPNWEGRASRMLDDMRDCLIGIPDPRTWPKTPQQLSNRLKRLAPYLDHVGLELSFRIVNGDKLWSLRAKGSEGIDTSDTPDNPHFRDIPP